MYLMAPMSSNLILYLIQSGNVVGYRITRPCLDCRSLNEGFALSWAFWASLVNESKNDSRGMSHDSIER